MPTKQVIADNLTPAGEAEGLPFDAEYRHIHFPNALDVSPESRMEERGAYLRTITAKQRDDGTPGADDKVVEAVERFRQVTARNTMRGLQEVEMILKVHHNYVLKSVETFNVSPITGETWNHHYLYSPLRHYEEGTPQDFGAHYKMLEQLYEELSIGRHVSLRFSHEQNRGIAFTVDPSADYGLPVVTHCEHPNTKWHARLLAEISAAFKRWNNQLYRACKA